MTYQSTPFALFYSNFSSSYTIPLFFPIFLNTILISFRFLFIFFNIIIAQTTVLHNRHFDTKKAEPHSTLCDSAKLFSLIFKPQNHENRVKCQPLLLK